MKGRWNPPFVVFVERSDGTMKILAKELDYPYAIQLRHSWQRELVKQGYSHRFGNGRFTKGDEWQECRIKDVAGREIRE